MEILQEMSPVQALGGADLELNLANELHIPKREVPAAVTFLYAWDRPQPCLFSLSYYSLRRSGEESLSEYLNSVYSFFPLHDKASGAFFIVHVNQILTVLETPVLEIGGGRPLRLLMQNGDALLLYVCEPRHAWRSRPLDLLNDAGRFVSFIQGDHTRIHVNKRHIVRVEGL